MDEVEHTYLWYEERFCRDLGLCHHEQQGWGYTNRDATKIEMIARYYLGHTEYCRVGREMLVESLLCSFEDAFEDELLAPAQQPRDTQDLIRQAVLRAMSDLYDRDALRPFWDTPDLPNDPNPVGAWMRKQFPDWIPPPSVWSQ